MCSGGGDVSSSVTRGSFSPFQSKFNLKIYRDNQLYISCANLELVKLTYAAAD